MNHHRSNIAASCPNSVIFPSAGHTQSRLHVRITWRSFKTYQCLSLVTHRLNQDVCVLDHLPGWITLENFSSPSSCHNSVIFHPSVFPWLPQSPSIFILGFALDNKSKSYTLVILHFLIPGFLICNCPFQRRVCDSMIGMCNTSFLLNLSCVTHVSIIHIHHS